MSKDELRTYRRVYEGLPFERAFTPFEYAPNVARATPWLVRPPVAGSPTTQEFPMERP
ncbi:MAG: hypothetical protein WKF75_12665 [Singulisphaera sp.]